MSTAKKSSDYKEESEPKIIKEETSDQSNLTTGHMSPGTQIFNPLHAISVAFRLNGYNIKSKSYLHLAEMCRHSVNTSSS